MTTNHTHPKDCPHQKAAAIDRKQHEAARAERQRQRQILAHAECFEWYQWSGVARGKQINEPVDFDVPAAAPRASHATPDKPQEWRWA